MASASVSLRFAATNCFFCKRISFHKLTSLLTWLLSCLLGKRFRIRLRGDRELVVGSNRLLGAASGDSERAAFLKTKCVTLSVGFHTAIWNQHAVGMSESLCGFGDGMCGGIDWQLPAIPRGQSTSYWIAAPKRSRLTPTRRFWSIDETEIAGSPGLRKCLPLV